MFFIDFRGRKQKVKNSSKYLIDWAAPSRSIFQRKVKNALEPFWNCEFVYEEFPIVGTRLTIDFYNASRRIALEIDGRQHYQYNAHMHGKNRQNFMNQIRRDCAKDEWCEWNEIELLRITHEDENKINSNFLKSIGAI